jgi:hypothetical protein
MVLMIIGIVLAFLKVMNSGLGALPKAIIGAVVQVYFFICIYSLYDMIKNEKLGNNTQVHMGSPQTMVYVHPQQVQGYPAQQQPYQYQPQGVGYAQPPQQVQGYPVQQQPYQYQPQGVGYAQPPMYDQVKSNPA